MSTKTNIPADGMQLFFVCHCLTYLDASFIIYYEFLWIIARKRLPTASVTLCTWCLFFRNLLLLLLSVNLLGAVSTDSRKLSAWCFNAARVLNGATGTRSLFWVSDIWERPTCLRSIWSLLASGTSATGCYATCSYQHCSNSVLLTVTLASRNISKLLPSPEAGFLRVYHTVARHRPECVSLPPRLGAASATLRTRRELMDI